MTNYHLVSISSHQCELTELSQQLTQQADYCSSMGAACCTLLWRVSRHEDCIHSILGGVSQPHACVSLLYRVEGFPTPPFSSSQSKVQEFLALTGSTLQSFLATYGRGEMPGETSEEAQFVLALCGIITSEGATIMGVALSISLPLKLSSGYSRHQEFNLHVSRVPVFA